MNITHFFDVVAPLFTLTGVWMIGRKQRAGWIVSSVGTVLWIGLAIVATVGGRPVWGLIGNSVVMLVLNARAWWAWRPQPTRLRVKVRLPQNVGTYIPSGVELN